MWRTVGIIAILSVVGNGQDDPCAGLAVAACFQNSICVYQGGSCALDSCIRSTTQNECEASPSCYYVGWAESCFNYQALCTGLARDACSSNPLCITSGDNCVYSVPTKTVASPPAECLGFPTWSIALLILWLLLIGILVFVVLIIRKKPQKTDVEESKVVIEEDAINDNFSPNDLDEPLYN